MIYPIARKEPTSLLADRESGLQVIGEIGRSRWDNRVSTYT